MPVSLQDPINSSIANGVTTVFPYQFLIPSADAIAIEIDGVLTTTGFTISGVGNASGGNVTFAVAPVNGARVVRYRDLDAKRDFDWTEGGDLLASAHDANDDYVIMLVQQLLETIGRAPTVGRSSAVTRPIELPEGALKYLRWSADGLVLEAVDGIAAVADAGTLIYTDNVPAAVPYLKTVSDIINGLEVSFFRFLNQSWHAQIKSRIAGPNVGARLREACAALQNARLYIPSGVYDVSDTVTDAAGTYVANVGQRTHIRGDGKHATSLLFNPTLAASLFRFKEGVSVCYQSSCRGIGFAGFGAFRKTVFELYDTSECTLEDFAVYPWTGANSQGVWLRGREITKIDDYSISADVPFYIGPNPNSIYVGCDHLTLGKGHIFPSATNYGMTIENGVPVTRFHIAGYAAFVGGVGILKWVEDPATGYNGQHVGIRIENIGGEQFVASANYAIDIQPRIGVQSVTIENVNLGVNLNGIKLYRPAAVTLMEVQYDDPAKRFLEVLGQSGTIVNLIGCKPQVGSTVLMTNLTRRIGVPEVASGTPIEGTSVWAFEAGNQGDGIMLGDLPHYPLKFTLAHGASRDLHLGTNSGVKGANVVVIANSSAGAPTKWATGEVTITAVGGGALRGAVGGDFAFHAAAAQVGKLTLVHTGPTSVLWNDTGETLMVGLDIKYIQ